MVDRTTHTTAIRWLMVKKFFKMITIYNLLKYLDITYLGNNNNYSHINDKIIWSSETTRHQIYATEKSL